MLKFIKIYIAILPFLISCTHCEKLYLVKSELDWVENYHLGQTFIFKSNKGNTDRLDVKEIRRFHTDCNKLELSKFQNEIFDVEFSMKTSSGDTGRNCLLVLTKNMESTVDPEIFVGSLGTKKNSLERKPLLYIDITLENVKYHSINYFKKNLNAETYGNTETIVDFFWDKKQGLIAYTTNEGEFFIRKR